MSLIRTVRVLKGLSSLHIPKFSVCRDLCTDKIRTTSDEWYLKENNYYKVGLTNTITEDILYVDVEEETEFKTDETIAIIETVKAAGEINSLFDCKLVEVNEEIIENLDELNDNPEDVNNWILKLEPLESFEITDEIIKKIKIEE
jgi:glycine cleavage system H protein